MSNSDKNLPLSIDSYRVHLLLGQGCQAKVYLCSNQQVSNQLICIKVYEQNYNESYQRQKESLCQLDHENVINIIDWKQNSIVKYSNNVIKNRPVILLQFVYYGDLFSFIEHNPSLSEGTAKFIFIQILNALKQLKKTKICHRDIKLQNILVDNNFNVKFIDFGLSSPLDQTIDQNNHTRNFGTSYTKAPQTYLSNYSCAKIDLFASSVIFFVLLFGRLPFENSKFSNPEYKLIYTGKQEQFWKCHLNKCKNRKLLKQPQVKQLFIRLFNKNVEQRLSLEQVLNNKWLFTNVPTKYQVGKQLKNVFVGSVKGNKQKLYQSIDKLIETVLNNNQMENKLKMQEQGNNKID